MYVHCVPKTCDFIYVQCVYKKCGFLRHILNQPFHLCVKGIGSRHLEVHVSLSQGFGDVSSDMVHSYRHSSKMSKSTDYSLFYA